MRRWNALEHLLHRRLRPWRGKPLLLACSGGLDSMAALSLLHTIAPKNLTVAYVHHGHGPDTQQNKFRDRAQRQVRLAALRLDVPFITNNATTTATIKGESEAQLRAIRYHHLKNWQGKEAILITAHHRDDLVETQLLHLIRGCGPLGLLGLGEWNPEMRLLRPLLTISRVQLAEYARERGLRWLRDPSNHDKTPLRNWLRSSWLPQLERKRAGSVRTLARSLELVARSLVAQPLAVEHGALNRQLYQQMTAELQSQAIVELFRQNAVRSYTKAHVEEFRKRLDTSQKLLTFRLLRREWQANAQRTWSSNRDPCDKGLEPI
jgi:tRNA(Ile)-lysidine synthetase-like protein